MENRIENVFIDLESYNLIKERYSVDELISFIQNNTTSRDIHPLSIAGHLFEVEFHPRNDYLGFTFTLNGFHDIYHEKCRFKNSIYLYSTKAMSAYEDGFSGITLLLYTAKKTLYVVPRGENDVSIMDCLSGKFIRKL